MTTQDAPDPTPAPTEEEYEAFVRANLKRNYAGNYIHGMLGMTGFRLLNAPTFVPAYLFNLSGSDAIVGLGLAAQQLGQVVSPMLGASHVEHRKRVLPEAVKLGLFMRAPVLLMALAGWTLHGPWLLWSFIILLLALGLAGGAQRVVFQLLMAKVIPVNLRGRLQAMRNFTGGLIAAILSWVAGKYFIEHNMLGNGYATTFMLAFVLTSLGLGALKLMMREPDPISVRPKTRLRDRAKDMHSLVAADKDYRNFLIAQSFAIGARLAAPFYILHAAQVVHLNGAALGVFSLAYLGADTLSNLVWGHFGDKSGFRSSFIAALVIGIGSLALLLTAQSMPMLALALAGFGASASGYMLSVSTMVLEFGGREDTAMRLGVSTTVEGVGASLGPLVGGLIAHQAGYPIVFCGAMLLQAMALGVLIFGVKEPRLRRKAFIEAPP